MALRKIDLPFDEIKDVFKALRQASDKQIDDLMSDPEHLARTEKAIDDALDKFEAEAKRSKS
jgi:hypothetical protein